MDNTQLNQSNIFGGQCLKLIKISKQTSGQALRKITHLHEITCTGLVYMLLFRTLW
jgi:hypothetical protein